MNIELLIVAVCAVIYVAYRIWSAQGRVTMTHDQNNDNCACADCVKAMQDSIAKLERIVNQKLAAAERQEQEIAEAHSAFMRSHAREVGN